MARTKVARTRLTQDEYDTYMEAASEAGVSPAEFLRTLIVAYKPGVLKLEARVTSVENRLTHVETEISRMWSQEGRHAPQRT